MTRQLILYSVIRIGLFAGAFALLMLMGIWWWASALIAAVVAFCLSLLLLQRPREAISRAVYDWRHADRDPDNDLENEAIDRAGNDGRA